MKRWRPCQNAPTLSFRSTESRTSKQSRCRADQTHTRARETKTLIHIAQRCIRFWPNCWSCIRSVVIFQPESKRVRDIFSPFAIDRTVSINIGMFSNVLCFMDVFRFIFRTKKKCVCKAATAAAAAAAVQVHFRRRKKSEVFLGSPFLFASRCCCCRWRPPKT